MSKTPLESVREYLTAAEERRLEEAAAHLDQKAILVFPQGQFRNLADMVATMSNRYRSIGKTHHTWDVSSSGVDTVVTTTGTLHGVNNHGVSFEGIRFCDRFVVRDGLIAEQHVWNDLAESGVLEQR